MDADNVSEVAQRLGWFFRRNGYVRWYNAERHAELGRLGYRKGDEVRLVANSHAELIIIRRLLRAAGFKAKRPFRKGLQYRQPIYGRADVARFLELIGETPDA